MQKTLTAAALANTHIEQCRVCAADDVTVLYRQPSFDVLRCRQCEAVFVRADAKAVETVVAEENAKAAAEGADYIRNVFVQNHDFWLAHWTERLEEVEALLGRRGSLLDIGSALGHFQLAAEARGWTTVGTELSQDQVHFAVEEYGLDMRCELFEEAGFAPESFDLVTAWSVIEHVPDPKAFLANARALLKPDGLLALQTPNQDSLVTWLAGAGYRLSGGRRLLGVYSYDHIFRFNSQALSALLERSGYEVVRIYPYDNLDVMVTRMSLQPRGAARRAALTLLHQLAAVSGRQNQLVAYARPRV